MSQKHSLDLSKVKEVTHGTTVATNAILQRSGAKTGLITTRGFRMCWNFAESACQCFTTCFGTNRLTWRNGQMAEVTERVDPQATC